MPNKLTTLLLASTTWAVSAGLGFAQVAKPEGAVGPSGGQLVTNFLNWFANHQTAAIVIAVSLLALVGMYVYNRIWPSA